MCRCMSSSFQAEGRHSLSMLIVYAIHLHAILFVLPVEDKPYCSEYQLGLLGAHHIFTGISFFRWKAYNGDSVRQAELSPIYASTITLNES